MASPTIDSLFQIAAPPRPAESGRAAGALPFEPALRQALAPPASTARPSAPPEGRAPETTGDEELQSKDQRGPEEEAQGPSPVAEPAETAQADDGDTEEPSEQPVDEAEISEAAAGAAAAAPAQAVEDAPLAAEESTTPTAALAVRTQDGGADSGEAERQESASGEPGEHAEGAQARRAGQAGDGDAQDAAPKQPPGQESDAAAEGDRRAASSGEAAVAEEASRHANTENGAPEDDATSSGREQTSTQGSDETAHDRSSERDGKKADRSLATERGGAPPPSSPTARAASVEAAPSADAPAATDAAASAAQKAPGDPTSAAQQAPANAVAEIDRGNAARTAHADAVRPREAEAGLPVDRARFVQRVEGALRRAQEGEGRLQIRLSPPELGALRVEIALQNGVMTARLEAETTAARNLLMENLPALRERLAEQDIRIEKFDVDVRREGADQGGGNGARDRSPEQQPSWRPERNGSRAAAPQAEKAGEPSANQSTKPSDAGLDVRV